MTLQERSDQLQATMRTLSEQNQKAIEAATNTKKAFEYYQAQVELLSQMIADEAKATEATPEEPGTIAEESLPPFVAHADQAKDLPEAAREG